MIRILKSGSRAAEAYLRLSDGGIDPEIALSAARIVEDVRLRGIEAVREYNAKFDGCTDAHLEVTEDEIDRAYAAMPKRFTEVLNRAAKNITAYHEKQLRGGFDMNGADGIRLGQRVLPLARVGVYVPGGTASYPSTLLMSVIPARVAGVKEVVIISPPNEGGTIRKEILAAAKIAGATKIYKAGGAHGIAALAYGAGEIPQVDKIVGPGNAFVAAAKRIVFGTVSIDMIAGPSEVLIIADESASPAFVAADMLSQAEHDKNARAILLCVSESFANEVSNELESRLKTLARRDIARASIDNMSAIILVESLLEAAKISDRVAPEHLELAVDKPFELMDKVKNAGSIFLGHFSPEPLGDYYAGPNHTLPTSGTARFSSPLSVDDFIKKNSYIYYTQAALSSVADDVAYFADSEGLTAHGDSIRVRAKDGAK